MSTPSPSPTPCPTLLTAVDTAAINGNTAEWWTVGVAGLALLLSGVAIWFVRRSERRQLFIQLHDLLTSVDSQVGRRILLTRMKTPRQISVTFHLRPGDFDRVNRALGLYNTLGIYAHRKYVPRDEALDHWAGRVRHNWTDIERFLRWRRVHSGDETMWSYLVWFAQQAGAAVSPDMRLRDGWDARTPREPAA